MATGLGAGLQSLGQSLDPARLSQAMLNFQELERRKEEDKRFSQQMLQYEHMKTHGDKDISKLFSQGEKFNPDFNRDFKSFQNHKANMAMAADSIRDLKSQSEALGILPEEMDMHMKLIYANPRQAPNIVNRVLTEKSAVMRQNMARQAATDSLGTYEAAGIMGGQNIMRQAIADKMHINNPMAFEELKKLSQFSEDPAVGTGTGGAKTQDLVSQAEGLKLLFESGDIDENFLQDMIDDPEAVDRFKNAKTLGEARLLLDAMKATQLSEARESTIDIEENRRRIEDAGVQVRVGNNDVILPTNRENQFELSIPGRKDKLMPTLQETSVGPRVFVDVEGFQIAPERDGNFFVTQDGVQVGEQKLRDLITGTMRSEDNKFGGPSEVASDLEKTLKILEKLDAKVNPSQSVVLDRAIDMAAQLEDALLGEGGTVGLITPMRTRREVRKEIKKDVEKLAEARLTLMKIDAIMSAALLEGVNQGSTATPFGEVPILD